MIDDITSILNNDDSDDEFADTHAEFVVQAYKDGRWLIKINGGDPIWFSLCEGAWDEFLPDRTLHVGEFIEVFGAKIDPHPKRMFSSYGVKPAIVKMVTTVLEPKLTVCVNDDKDDYCGYDVNSITAAIINIAYELYLLAGDLK